MTHPDCDRLIALALGETDDDASAHLAGCGRCWAELATLRQLSSFGAHAQSVRHLPEPPPHVWTNIERTLGATTASIDLAAERARRVGPAERSRRDTPAAGARHRRRGRRWPTWTMAAAASIAAVPVAVAVTLTVARPPDAQAPDQIVTSAVLEAVGETPPGVHGEAEVLADGRLRLRVSELPPVSGYYQVWLIDPRTLRMFPLGVLGQGSVAQLPMPSDVDLKLYSVVDVSAERFDNNPGPLS